MPANDNNLPPAGRELVEKFTTGQAKVGVIGLGYVGLPLAVLLAEAGYRVVGVDTDESTVAAINRGESHVLDISRDTLAPLVEAGSLTASTSYDDLSDVDGISISVPTPLRKTGDPDLSYIMSAARELAPSLHSPMVVILESTTYPGTTREVVLPELNNSGLTVGEDLFLAFSPERVDPGRTDWTTKNTPKVIGGITDACTTVAAAMYNQAIDSVVEVSSTEVAEMTKLLENTFRAVNIAMVNEMALMCERLGLDVWEVIEAAATKPFGFMKFTPGPGLGGHCIPIDPLYLSWKLKSVKYNARFIELASEINTAMPRYVVQRIQDAMNERGKAVQGAKFLVLGAAFKPNVSDTRESPAIDVIGLLRDKGAEVSYFDPHVPAFEDDGWGLTSVSDPVKSAQEADCVVIVTDHAGVDYERIQEVSQLIFDTRNALKGEAGEKVVKL
ncbi:MAG: nucleotide sugar dehydrogenase [Anaerolineae bacterium]|nr:MAG: nucleotide sugar dehydrogenase [Anaerolineae bacterium]